MSRRRSHFVKRAIDAITDFEFIFERFEMNVAGPVLDRLIQNQIDKANDRGSATFCFCSSCTIAFPQLHQLVHSAQLLQHLFPARGVAVVECAAPVLHRLVKSGFIHEAAVDQRLHTGLAVLLRFGQDIVGLRFLQNVVIDKKIEDLLVIHQFTSAIVTEMTSSAEVRPESTLRTPSSRKVRMLSSRARWRKRKVEVRLLIMCRTSSSMMKISKIPIRPR